MMKPESRHNLIHGITLALLFFTIALALHNGTQAAPLNQLTEAQRAAAVQDAQYRQIIVALVEQLNEVQTAVAQVRAKAGIMDAPGNPPESLADQISGIGTILQARDAEHDQAEPRQEPAKLNLNLTPEQTELVKTLLLRAASKLLL